MSPNNEAALDRCRQFAETIAYELEGIDEDERSVSSAQLLVAARTLLSALNVFAERTKTK